MRRASKDEAPGGASSPDEKLEAFFSRFLGRNPRFLVVGGFVVGIVIFVAIVMAKMWGR